MIKIAIISLFAIALVTFAMRLMPKLRHLFQIHKSPDNVMIMKRYVRISIFGLLFPILASINVAWAKNWNQNKEPVSGSDLKCEMLLHKYTSPSINGCVFSINASGSASFRRNGRTGSIEVCDPNAKESDVKEITKDLEGFFKPATLLITNHENGYSGKITLRWAGTPIETELPFMEKDFSGTANAVMDTGIKIRLKVAEKAELDLSGDMGFLRLRGSCEADNTTFSIRTNFQTATDKEVCEQVAVALGEDGLTFNIQIIDEDGTVKNQGWIYEAKRRWGKDYGIKCQNVVRASQSPSTPAPPTSKLDKAKSTCTELGFTTGTEKHGECVLKLMDK